ncbi:glycosyltransferase family 2 protein [Sphingomonas sp. VNH70]|uniref:glycosyltransferase family A protein n=1 Tax=Sphingomonas silueang TaxID=3156617 RepID=UPI0032B340D7
MNWSDDGARVSCVMVTANRARLARRAVDCFLAQTHGNRELVVIDDGDADYTPLFAAIPPDRLVYDRVAKTPDTTLGRLRNRSLDRARGQVVAQWDDDDWYHPTRLSRQLAVLDAGKAACVLRGTLMHLDAPEWFDHPYVGTLEPGVPGSIVHRADRQARYPEKRRGEDTDFLGHWAADAIGVLDAPGLFVRAFHGGNTWERDHFERRVRNTPAAAIEYALRRFLPGGVWRHSRFRLDAGTRAAFAAFVADSRRAGVFA